jgi:hypothetical protein
MADSKISALPASTTPLAGTEVLPIVQSSATKQVSVANLTAGRSFDALGMALTSTDAGAAAAPLLDLYRNSASPAAVDTIGEIEFNGQDSAGNKQQYAVIHASILSPTSTAEQGQIHFETATAGASTEKMIIGTTNLVINDIGAIYNVRIEGDTDANLFYTDATNSLVGIGTISPAEKLDVVGNIKSSGTVFVGAGGTGATDAILKLNGSSAANQGAAIRFDRNSANKAYIGTASQIIGGASDTLTLWANTGIGWDIYANATLALSVASTGIVTMSAYGAGTATFSAAGVISSVSDETWKVKDGAPVDTDAMLKKLEPGYWYYNDEKKETFGADRQLGFYAQNVNAAIGPEAAPTPEEGKPWGYYDRSVLAVTVMSLQKALATIESLVSRIAVLESKVL